MDSKAIVQTGVKVWYDDTHLYLLFTCSTLSTDDQDIEYLLVGFDTNHNGGIDYTFEIDKNGRVQGEKDGIMDWNMEMAPRSVFPPMDGSQRWLSLMPLLNGRKKSKRKCGGLI